MPHITSCHRGLGIVTADMREYKINIEESDECQKKEWTVVSSTHSKCTALTSKHLNTRIYIFTLHHSGSTDDPLIYASLQEGFYHINQCLGKSLISSEGYRVKFPVQGSFCDFLHSLSALGYLISG